MVKHLEDMHVSINLAVLSEKRVGLSNMFLEHKEKQSIYKGEKLERRNSTCQNKWLRRNEFVVLSTRRRGS